MFWTSSFAWLLVLPLAAAPKESDWPRFHGPRGDNIWHETGLLKQWPEGGPRLLWTATGIGEGYSSVSIAAGQIYTSGNLRDHTVVTALGLDGRIHWQAAAGDPWTGSYPGTRGTPTVDGGRVYHESPLGHVVCLETKSGQEAWSLNLLEEYDSRNITWGLAESLLVDGDRLICCPGGAHTSVVALDKRTGKAVWASKPTGDLAGYATPALVEYQGLRIILAMTQRALIGVNAENGELLFRHSHETRHGANVATPIFHDGQVFITSGYGAGSEMLRLALRDKKLSAEPVWRCDDLDNLHGGVILLDGCLYGAAHEARGSHQTPWISLDWKTGKRLHAGPGVGKGSLTCADGMLYAMSEAGAVGLVDPGRGAPRVVSTFQLPKTEKGPAWAHPVVCGGRLYIRRNNRLYAYEIGQLRQ